MNQSPLAVVHPEAKIGQNVTIDPFAVIEKDVVIGDNCHIYSHAVILDGARIGDNCSIFPGAVIAGIPQDLKFKGEQTTAEIGKNTTIRDDQPGNSIKGKDHSRKRLPDYGIFPYRTRLRAERSYYPRERIPDSRRSGD